jgi:hypothetical protein
MENITKLIISVNVITSLVLLSLVLGSMTGYADIEIRTGKSFLNLENNEPTSTFTITREMADKLNANYRGSEKEFAACLNFEQKIKNEKENSISVSYEIGSFETPITFFEEGFSRMGYCESGVIHSHPKGTCYFSIADIHSFKQRIKKGEFFSVLVCGEDDFYIITRNDFDERPLPIV